MFRVLKGVSTVDYCHKNNALVTGSTDQIIRIWNPFINTYACLHSIHYSIINYPFSRKPVAHLFGQGSPIFSLKVDSEEDRIYSIGNDNAIRVSACIIRIAIIIIYLTAQLGLVQFHS